MLIGSDHRGAWNEEGASIAVTVLPPWWQTWPFRIVVLAAVALAFAAAYRVGVKYFVEKNLELQVMAGKLIRSQEDERRRIARELHDDLNQKMAMVAVELGMVARDLPPKVQDEVSRIKEQAIEVSEDLRQVSHPLHPATLENLGLVRALERYCNELEKHEDLHVEFRAPDASEEIPSDAATCLYRIAQESLRNVVKHAGASRAKVTLESSKGGLLLRVEDDGAGFDPEARGLRGIGLVGMEERVRPLNGRFALRSAPGEGTGLEAWVPIAVA